MTDTASLVTQVANRMLDDADWARQRLAPFSGECFVVAMQRWQLCFEVTANGCLAACAPGSAQTAAVTIRLDPAKIPAETLLDADINRLMQAVSLHGQAEMADALGFVFRNLRPDIEEAFARHIGDIPAHRLGLVLKAMHYECRRSVRGTIDNLVEYATYEANWLPDRLSLTEFNDDVCRFRDDIARLEKRLQHLPQSQGDS